MNRKIFKRGHYRVIDVDKKNKELIEKIIEIIYQVAQINKNLSGHKITINIKKHGITIEYLNEGELEVKVELNEINTSDIARELGRARIQETSKTSFNCESIFNKVVIKDMQLEYVCTINNALIDLFDLVV